MSVYIDNCDCCVKMKKENVEAAFTAVKTLIIEKKYGQYYDSDWYKRLEEVDNIDTLLEVCGWETEVENYDIVGLRFDGENYNSDDIILFIALAPYIEAGSYIQIETSDFQKFEWYFDGYTVVRKEGMVDFDSNIEIVEALLKDKKLLPQLLGIHPELDKRIAEVLKG